MARSRFGELEEQVVLALLQLDGESYAVPVAGELVRLTGRDVSPATAYMVMRRLESRGFLTSRVGTPDPDRGGRPRRFYRVVTDAVIPALSASRQAMLALWEGLEPMLDKPGALPALVFRFHSDSRFGSYPRMCERRYWEMSSRT